MKIGVISDTHGLLRPEVTKVLSGCDMILHAGNIDYPVILDRLEAIAPVIAVCGNCDWDFSEDLPLVKQTRIEGRLVCMAHRKYDLPGDTSLFDLVIFGHSHKYEERRSGKTVFLNPGRCGPRRFGQDVTMALVDLTDDGIYVKRVDIC